MYRLCNNVPSLLGDALKTFVIGEETEFKDYVAKIVQVFREIRRILKPTGAVWLNVGDKYVDKNLMGIPWRIAIAMQDDGWKLRNDVIWEKMKGAQPVKDRLRNNYEHLFYFVKNGKNYFDGDGIRIEPRLQPDVTETTTVSATGVSGKKYRRQILESKYLSESERQAALTALENVLQRIRDGEVIDFRMTIRGCQRTLHGNSGRLSGRARELEEKGFYIMQSYAKGYIPSDIWRIVPEDKVKKPSFQSLRRISPRTAPHSNCSNLPAEGCGTRSLCRRWQHDCSSVGIQSAWLRNRHQRKTI